MASKEKEAFYRVFCVNYVGELTTGDGYPIEYSQAKEEKDWEIVKQAIDELEEYKKYIPNLEELYKWCKGDYLQQQGMELKDEVIK